MNYTFKDRFEVAAASEPRVLGFLYRFFPGSKIERSSGLLDLSGADWVVRLRDGETVLIDSKERTKGCSKYWGNGPEFALETDSVVGKKIGWTLSESSRADYILFYFDETDCGDAYLVPFQLLRIAFRSHLEKWLAEFKSDYQSSDGWRSRCVFVPMRTVWEAIFRASKTPAQISPSGG